MVLTIPLVSVDAGHRAVIFDRFRGVQDIVVGEGTHFLIPWVQKPIVFDCRSRPRNVPVITGSKGKWGVEADMTYCLSTRASCALKPIDRVLLWLMEGIC